METFLAVLGAIAAIPAIGELVVKFASWVTVWYLTNNENGNLSAIADAFAFGAKAKTKEQRIESAKKWRDALSRPRITA